jgi:hypothetical protein
MWLYVPEVEWGLILPSALLAAAVAFPVYERDSYWLAPAIVLLILVMAQSLIGARQAPSIPGLIVITALIQWVFAPWASYHLPSSFVMYGMMVTSQDYFSFAVPATLVLAAGVYVPLAITGAGSQTRMDSPRYFSPTMRRALRKTCDIMVVTGLIVSVAALAQLPEMVRYLGVLVADLACVGAFALCLLRENGWGWRVGAVLGEQFILASVDGVFHDMLLWSTYFLLILAFRDRLRVRTLVLVAVTGLYAVAALSSIKLQYRRGLEEMPSISAGDRIEVLSEAVGAQLLHPTHVFSEEEVRYGITRLNQGWIISRILTWVPTREPYARGETVINAIENAATPRVLSPDKYRSGGYAYFQRFTGVRMDRASMNLGLSGEMYANFGRYGAFAAIFIWGALLGLLLLQLTRAAQRSLLWWAWVPYVMLYTVQAETGIGEVVNQVSKSMVVMLVVITFVPAWRSLRMWRLPELLDRRLRAAST